jgi:hypothetical protein
MEANGNNRTGVVVADNADIGRKKDGADSFAEYADSAAFADNLRYF